MCAPLQFMIPQDSRERQEVDLSKHYKVIGNNTGRNQLYDPYHIIGLSPIIVVHLSTVYDNNVLLILLVQCKYNVVLYVT